MGTEHQDVFLALDDKLDKTLKGLRIETPGSEDSITIEIKNALKSVERGLGILVANTNVATHKVNPAAFKEANIDQLLNDIRRLGVLTRRIERELKVQTTFNK